MTKRTTKGTSSIPNLTGYLETNLGPVLRMPRRISDTSSLKFEEHLTTWSKTWAPLGEGIPLVKYVGRKALVAKIRLPDGKIFAEYAPQTFPEDQKKELLDWSQKTIRTASGTLEVLFERYQISPVHVLDILGSYKASRVKSKKIFEIASHVRSARLREKHARLLRKVAPILKMWEPLKSLGINSYPNADTLEDIADKLLQFGPSQAHRPPEIQLKQCAQELKVLFYRCAKRSLYRYIGELMRAAFPDLWNPAGDIREAAKKLAKAEK